MLSVFREEKSHCHQLFPAANIPLSILSKIINFLSGHKPRLSLNASKDTSLRGNSPLLSLLCRASLKPVSINHTRPLGLAAPIAWPFRHRHSSSLYSIPITTAPADPTCLNPRPAAQQPRRGKEPHARWPRSVVRPRQDVWSRSQGHRTARLRQSVVSGWSDAAVGVSGHQGRRQHVSFRLCMDDQHTGHAH